MLPEQFLNDFVLGAERLGKFFEGIGKIFNNYEAVLKVVGDLSGEKSVLLDTLSYPVDVVYSLLSS